MSQKDWVRYRIFRSWALPNCRGSYQVIFLNEIVQMPHILIIFRSKTDKALVIYTYIECSFRVDKNLQFHACRLIS